MRCETSACSNRKGSSKEAAVGTEAGARQRSSSQSQEIKLCLIVEIMQSLELHSGTR